MRALPAFIVTLASLAGCAASGVVPARIEDLVDVRWHWVAIIRDGAVAAQPDPSRHWFEAGAGGAIIVQADCNSGLGRRPSIDSLRFGPIALTRRFCGADSRDATFAAALSGVNDAGLDAGLLRLAGGGTTLLFTRAKDARLQRYLCPAGPIDVLWGDEAAWLVGPEASRPFQRTEPGAAMRYTGRDATVERDGEDLMLTERVSGTRSRCVPGP